MKRTIVRLVVSTMLVTGLALPLQVSAQSPPANGLDFRLRLADPRPSAAVANAWKQQSASPTPQKKKSHGLAGALIGFGAGFGAGMLYWAASCAGNQGKAGSSCEAPMIAMMAGGAVAGWAIGR
jgi:hypothetical protein